MKIIKETWDDLQSDYTIETLGNLSDILFIDIETTGFSAKRSHLYLIGLLYYADNSWNLLQYFAQNKEEEIDILKEFILFAKDFSILVHFNGNGFDIPYLKQKCETYQLSHPLDQMDGVDLYKRFSPFKHILHLENCKQKTIEDFIGVKRLDQYHGGELISIYKEYTTSPDTEQEELLLLHNSDDMRGMFRLLPILTYYDTLFVPFRITKVQANTYTDANDFPASEVVMNIRFHSPFPQPFTLQANGCYFSGAESKGTLKVPLLKETLKYFYSNYKDYYYLPEEDTALHKSVAGFVDKEYREQATAKNCYTKKASDYLPQWDIIFEPIFKREYKDSTCYFELTEEMKKSPEEFRQYALHILDMMIHNKSS